MGKMTMNCADLEKIKTKLQKACDAVDVDIAFLEEILSLNDESDDVGVLRAIAALQRRVSGVQLRVISWRLHSLRLNVQQADCHVHATCVDAPHCFLEFTCTLLTDKQFARRECRDFRVLSASEQPSMAHIGQCDDVFQLMSRMSHLNHVLSERRVVMDRCGAAWQERDSAVHVALPGGAEFVWDVVCTTEHDGRFQHEWTVVSAKGVRTCVPPNLKNELLAIDWQTCLTEFLDKIGALDCAR